MLNALKKLFSSAPQTAFDKLHKNGAQIIDVRTPGEFQQGHIKGSVNIPLQVLPNQTSKIKKANQSFCVVLPECVVHLQKHSCK